MEAMHPEFAISALGDWVPRILQGISDTAMLTPRCTIQHPPLTLASTNESTPYMDLMRDAVATEPEPPVPPPHVFAPPRLPCIITTPRAVSKPKPDPRYIVEEVFSFVVKNGVLRYWVKWLNTTYYQQEAYKNLYHLEIFKDFEANLVPGATIFSQGKVATKLLTLQRYNEYILLRDAEISNLVEEYDTDSEEEEDDQQAMVTIQEPVSSFEAALESEDSLSWGDLLANADLLMDSPRDFGEGTSMGAAGPSHVNKYQRGGARTAKSWDDFATKQ
jgi:hypothetical protein